MLRFPPLALAWLIFGFSCGGSGASGSQQPSWRQSPTNASSKQQTATTAEFIELSASASTVSVYNNPPQTTAPESALSQSILAAVAEASVLTGQAAPIADGRLFQALSELAAVAPLDTPLTYSLIEFALQRNGIIEPSPHLVIIEGHIDSPKQIVEQLTERLPSILATGRFKRVGIGSSRRGESDLILLAFQESHLTTGAIPRELPLEGGVSIEGTLARGFAEPHLFHTNSSGEVSETSVALIGATGFRTRFACGKHRGRQQVEITASDTSGSTVLANFPIWCGEKAPLSLRVASGTSDPPPATQEEAEERMFALINEDRAAHGLPALSLDPRLTEIARKHSDEMLQTGEVAHVSPTTGSAADRVKAGQVRTSVVLENVARAYGVAEAELGLMNSPGHRANLLSKEVTEVGVGITLGEHVAGRRELMVTQLFIRVPKAINRAAVRKQVKAKIQGVKAMSSSPDLEAIAQSFANSLAKGVTTNAASAAAGKSLDENRGDFARVSTLVTTVATVDSFDPAGSLGGDKVRFYGVGIAQGSHEAMGDGAIFIVLLLAQR